MKEKSCRDEPMFKCTWEFENLAQAMFVHAVVMPEIMSIVERYEKDLKVLEMECVVYE